MGAEVNRLIFYSVVFKDERVVKNEFIYADEAGMMNWQLNTTDQNALETYIFQKISQKFIKLNGKQYLKVWKGRVNYNFQLHT